MCGTENIILTFSQWESLMTIADLFINRDIIELLKIRKDLVDWNARCLQSGTLAKPPKLNIPGYIDFDVLYAFMGC
jgi:hypothetical protein